MKHLHIDKHRIGGILMNTGHDIKLVIDEPSPHIINISGGPLTYQFRVCEIVFHFGSIDSLGSEHTIDGQSFPAEIQIMGYNIDLYGNLTQAAYSPSGLIVVGLLVQVGQIANMEFEMIAHEMKQVRYKGQQTRIRHLSVHGLLPETQDYITYDGSMTQPGCHETVTWVIMNRPIYVLSEHMMILRDIMQGDKNNPKVPMENNVRPTMPTNHRPMRTNINFPNHSEGCTMAKEMHYQANVWDRS
jgi:carbonic anhydrase